MARRRAETPPLSIDIFCHASAYWKSSAALGRECDFVFPYNLPMLVYQLFSAELFIKCLLKLRGRPIPHSHELPYLLGKLSRADQSRIKTRYYSFVRTECRMRVPWASTLTRSTALFDRSRYHFEGTPWESDKKGDKGNEGIGQLLKAVRQVIVESAPEYETFWHGLLKLRPGKRHAPTSPTH